MNLMQSVFTWRTRLSHRGTDPRQTEQALIYQTMFEHLTLYEKIHVVMYYG